MMKTFARLWIFLFLLTCSTSSTSQSPTKPKPDNAKVPSKKNASTSSSFAFGNATSTTKPSFAASDRKQAEKKWNLQKSPHAYSYPPQKSKMIPPLINSAMPRSPNVCSHLARKQRNIRKSCFKSRIFWKKQTILSPKESLLMMKRHSVFPIWTFVPKTHLPHLEAVPNKPPRTSNKINSSKNISEMFSSKKFQPKSKENRNKNQWNGNKTSREGQ